MTSFFVDAASELNRFHVTGSSRDFDKLVIKVRPKLMGYARRLVNTKRLGVVDVDDYVQEGIITIWRRISLFRYICPECKGKFEHHDCYSEHCRIEHGTYLNPVKSLIQFMDYNVRAYMKNHFRNMLRPKLFEYAFFFALSQLNSSYARIQYGETMSSCYEQPIGNFTANTLRMSPDILYDSKVAVECTQRLVADECNPKICILVDDSLNGVDRPATWEHISSMGLAKTPKSAAVCVNRLQKRRELWRKYRSALTDGG